ncbi:MAG: HAD-IA family hydrolase [Pseudomonadota bacterium]
MSVSVIFDLDGTLADTSKDLLNAANAVFETQGHGRPLEHPQDTATALRGGRAMLTLGASRRDGLGEAFIDDGYRPLLDFYAKNLHEHTALYDGVLSCLERLKLDGHVLGVCTNKPAWLAEPLLKALGIWDYFGAMLGADSLDVRKPDPEHLFETVRRAGGDVTRAVLIGDTKTDRDTSKAAGLPSILVGFGPLGGDIRALEPEAILNHYDDLPRLIADMFPN